MSFTREATRMKFSRPLLMPNVVETNVPVQPLVIFPVEIKSGKLKRCSSSVARVHGLINKDPWPFTKKH
jgi:hypothetical protein